MTVGNGETSKERDFVNDAWKTEKENNLKFIKKVCPSTGVEFVALQCSRKIKVWRDDKRVVWESLQVPTVLPKPPASVSRYVDTISRYLNYISFWASCKHFIGLFLGVTRSILYSNRSAKRPLGFTTTSVLR